MPAHNLDISESTSVEQRVFLIPSPNLPKFKEKFDKLVRRAQRIGCTIPTYTVLKEEPRTVQVLVDETEDEFGRIIPTYADRLVMFHHIVIHSGNVVVAGYEFVCTIEHTEEGNILHTRAGYSVPLKYRTCQPYCDHCKTLRRRNDTFIVRKINTDTYLQVGRNCLADFLGRDAEKYASTAELYYEVDELAEASESWGGGGSLERLDHLDDYLAYVAEVILREGWRSRSTAREYGGRATADIALWIMHPSKEDIRENRLPFRIPSDKSVEQAKLALEWCENISDSETEGSEYLHNIRTIARRGVVGGRQYGYAASIVSGYQRHMGELKRKARLADKAAISRHVGTVGERSRFVLEVEHVVHLPDYGYGESRLHLMSDKEGNCFTWKSSRETLEKGTSVVLKGTIKEHSEYKGVKQTVLTRCEKIDLKTYTAVLHGASYEVSAESEKEAQKTLKGMLNIARLPKGTTFVEKVLAPNTNEAKEGEV